MGKHDMTKEEKKFASMKNEKNNIHNKKNKKKKKHIVLKIFIILIIALGIFIGIRLHQSGGNWIAAFLGVDKETMENLDKLQVLILGESTGMSDTIIVASYDPQTQEAALLSIPRDTFTGSDISSANSYHKINSLYSYGETPEKTLEAVNEITGLDIKHYIIVDTEALIKLVDIIEGLEFDVPIDMNYDDPTQDLHIHLSAGYQTLTGEQVEELVRFRHNNDGTTYPYSYGMEDHGRMKTQRDVIIALAKQTIKLKNVTEIFNIIDTIQEYVETNMNFSDIKNYVPKAIEMNMENVKVGKLPGSDDVVNGIWFFFHNEEETEILVNELFYGIIESEEEPTDLENSIDNE